MSTYVCTHMLRLLSRIIAVVIMPAQTPGDVTGLLYDFSCAPLKTCRRLSPRVIWSLVRQLFGMRKLEIPEDSQLARLRDTRDRYLRKGWSE